MELRCCPTEKVMRTVFNNDPDSSTWTAKVHIDLPECVAFWKTDFAVSVASGMSEARPSVRKTTKIRADKGSTSHRGGGEDGRRPALRVEQEHDEKTVQHYPNPLPTTRGTSVQRRISCQAGAKRVPPEGLCPRSISARFLLQGTALAKVVAP